MIKTQADFLAGLEAVYARNIEISRAKNSDYANDNDPFKNFRVAAVFGVPVEQAIIVRMSDKMSRISNLLTREAKVKDETIKDTLGDLCNYAAILSVYLDSKNEQSGS